MDNVRLRHTRHARLYFVVYGNSYFGVSSTKHLAWTIAPKCLFLFSSIFLVVAIGL